MDCPFVSRSRRVKRFSHRKLTTASLSRLALGEMLERRHALAGQSLLAGIVAGQLPNVAAEAAPVALIPKVQLSHFGQDISFSKVVNGNTVPDRQKFSDWASDYISFVTNTGVSVCYINVGDYKADNKHNYDYLRPELGTDGKTPWIVTEFLDKLPAGVEAGAIAYLKDAWHLYEDPTNPNYNGNTLATDGKSTSPPKNNLYQSFELINDINAAQLAAGGTKYLTHYEADGEGAGAFEADSYYGFGGVPAGGAPYNKANNLTTPGGNWTWSAGANGTAGTATGWPVAGYGYMKWLFNHFMPGVTVSDVATGGSGLPASNNMPDVVYTDAEAVVETTWSANPSTAKPYQFGIIKYAQSSWLNYSPGPMVAFTENYWFGENHYVPGPGSSIMPDTAATPSNPLPTLNPPTTGNSFLGGAPPVMFNTPKDTLGNAVGTAATGYAVMGTGSIDGAAIAASGLLQNFFGGNGIGSLFGTGAVVASGQGGTGYLQGDIVWFTAPGTGGRAASGIVNTAGDRYTPSSIVGILITDPGEGYVSEPTVDKITKTDGTTPSSGTGATIQAKLLASNGYPQVAFPPSPAGGRQAKGYVTVSPQNYRPGTITGLVITDYGAGYNTGLLTVTFNGLSGSYTGQPLQVPVTTSTNDIASIVLTSLGDHYDGSSLTAANRPYYTLGSDRTEHYVGVNPLYSGAFGSVLNLVGSFAVDASSRSLLAILDAGSGYSAGAVVTNSSGTTVLLSGAGYDSSSFYPLTFTGGGVSDPLNQATGFANVNSDGFVTGITITNPGTGYTSEPTVVIPSPGTNTGMAQAYATAHLLNFPKVTISGGTPAGGTAASAYAIVGPADPKQASTTDPNTGYVITGIGFNFPGLKYTTVPNVTIAGGSNPNSTAKVSSDPSLVTKTNAYQLKTIGEEFGSVTGTAPAGWTGTIEGGANTFNWLIPNGKGPGQVATIKMTAVGASYTSTPLVTFDPAPIGGVTATGTAMMSDDGKTVVGIKITNAGYGYPTTTPPKITIGDGSNAKAEGTLGELQILSPQAQQTVYSYYSNYPAALAAMFNNQKYQDVALPKLDTLFYQSLDLNTQFRLPAAIDGNKTAQQAIATFSIESLNRSNVDANGNIVATCLDAKYSDLTALGQPNSLGGTFAGLSSLTYENFITFLNSAADIIVNAKPAGSTMTASDVTFQIYDAAFLPLEWLSGQSANRWSDVNATPVLIGGSVGSVRENASATTVIYKANATDMGATVADRTVTFSIKPGVGDAASVSIDRKTGEVRLSNSANYELKKTYQFVVIASDGGSPSLSAEKTITVSVTDLFEAPSPPQISVPTTFSVTEDTRTPLLFFGVPFTDADSAASKTMMVTLRVDDGVIAARSGAGIAVAGSKTARTFTGSLTALNNYFTRVPGRITYTPAANNTSLRPLSIALSESYGSFQHTSTTISSIVFSAVNDAPKVWAPAKFSVTEDVASSLTWPAKPLAISDIDSPLLTVTLTVADGTLAAIGGAGVTVGGTATSLTLRGSPTDLNAYVRQPSNVQYTSAFNNTLTRSLIISVSDGQLQHSATTQIRIQAVNDSPTQNPSALVIGAVRNKPFVINQSMLRSATAAADIDSSAVGFIVNGVTAGTVQKWNGSVWTTLGPHASLARRILAPGQLVRWTAPVNAVGTIAAFTVTAWDGQRASTVSSQVSVSIGVPDDNSFVYFLDDTTQAGNTPVGYGVIGEFSPVNRNTLTQSGRIVGQSVALKNNDGTDGFSLWSSIKPLFSSATPVAEGDKKTLAQNILNSVMITPSEFPVPSEGAATSSGGYVFWAQDFEFTPATNVSNAPVTDKVYAGVLAVMWAGKQLLGNSMKIYPVPSSSLFKTLGSATLGAYVSDHIIHGDGTTPYLASLGLTGLPVNPATGSGGEWNFLSLAYANNLIDGFFGQQYNANQVGIVTADTKPFYSDTLPYALVSSYDNPPQVKTGGPWTTVYNGNILFHAAVYWPGPVDSSWGQPPASQKLKPTQAPLPTTVFGLYGRPR